MQPFKKYIKDKLPVVHSLFLLLKLSIREKAFLPNKIKLKHSGNLLYANPFENRGRSLLKNLGTGQPFIKKFWRNSIDLFDPEIVVDIGANYGEVFLDCNYPPIVKKIFTIEANPYLTKYLKKSIEKHPNREKIQLINGLAGNQNIKKNSFFIDKTSSGRSTALSNNFVKKSQKVFVNSYRLDDLILGNINKVSRIVFKIDVEGYEPFVLSGMNKLLETTELIGCLEFNLSSLQKNSINIDDYLNTLNKYFYSIILHKNSKLENTETLTLSLLKKVFNNEHTEGDILVFTNQSSKNRFINQHSIESC